MKPSKLQNILIVLLVIVGFIGIFAGMYYGFRSGDGMTRSERTDVTRALPESGAFIGSAETKKFHFFYCSYLPDAENQVPFDTREEALAAGYTPCGHCNP